MVIRSNALCSYIGVKYAGSESMSIDLESIKLRLLTPPAGELKCVERYIVPSPQKPLYSICITGSTYVVWDSVAEDPVAVNELPRIEEKLYDVLVGDESLVDLIEEIKDERLKHIVEREYMGYGVLEPFLLDPSINNVHVMSNKPIQVQHRVHGRLSTNIVLNTDETSELALRLSAAAGKPLSEATPLTSFIEPRYEARVSIIFLSDITMRRSLTIDIRKPTEKPWTILKLINLGSISIEEAAFLWLMVKYKVPILIVGGMMSGKTTLATALLALIPPGSRVLTVEDTPEIRLPATYWTRTTTRDYGECKVSVFDILKVGVRLSQDYVIVGEIRGEEAREWAHSILLGHCAITTFHAESPEAAILRLISPPISLDPQVLRMLNVFVKTNLIEREPGKKIFRHEVYIHEEGVVTPLFIYNPSTDNIEPRVENPIKTLKFIDRVVLTHRTTREDLEREYRAMIETLEETYFEALNVDPSLDTPSYKELPEILYTKLYRKLGLSKS
ncbi:MAG: type II/IV secretion system ATPase subunit [Thermosphaera sp.]|nr:type II/IV secretion system ATPase subunit [Thermosphaera sp.]